MEKIITLGELIIYANEAKNQTKKALKEDNMNQIDINNIIKKVIDKLKEGEKVVVVVALGTHDFSVNGEKCHVARRTKLEDIKGTIDFIPDLKAKIELNNKVPRDDIFEFGGQDLKVWFS